ncbi:MAG: DUF2281 domain-containing protein [Saprospiraceae bacterium]
MMSTIMLYSKIELLPEHLQQQVLDYIEFLLSREGKSDEIPKEETPSPEFKPGFGGAKGMFVMASDFDEPLEDFKEYM